MPTPLEKALLFRIEKPKADPRRHERIQSYDAGLPDPYLYPHKLMEVNTPALPVPSPNRILYSGMKDSGFDNGTILDMMLSRFKPRREYEERTRTVTDGTGVR